MNRKIRKALSLAVTGLISAVLLMACGGQSSSSSSSSEASSASTTTSAAVTTTPPPDPITLTVSAAASLTDVMEEVATMYKETAPEVTITYNFGSSGALQTQIEEGAPADIFMSAAQKQMNALSDKELIVKESRQDLLINKVVLIAPADSDMEITGFEDLSDDKVSKIALGDPASVPVGQYSEQIFSFLDTLDAVKAKAVYGSDVRQVLTWVESGEVDCGVVYATDAATSDQVQVVAEAPEGSHDPVIYPVAILKDCKHPNDAAKFIEFIGSEKIAPIFEKYGFSLS